MEPEEEGIEYLLGEFNEEHGYEDDLLAENGEPGGQGGPKKRKYFYCDIESEFDDDKHIPIMHCMISEDGDKKWTFYGEDCLKQFLKEINDNDEFKDSSFVYHNLSGLVCDIKLSY